MCIVAKRSRISATAEQLYKVINFAGSAEIIPARGVSMKPSTSVVTSLSAGRRVASRMQQHQH